MRRCPVWDWRFCSHRTLGLDGKTLPVLLTGAALSGIAGVVAILYIRNLTRLKEDAALGIVLSVFFGAGIAILTIVQQVPSGHAAGLESFIYGKTASMIASDAQLIAAAGLLSVVIIALLFKELTLLCFDEEFCRVARVSGADAGSAADGTGRHRDHHWTAGRRAGADDCIAGDPGRGRAILDP